MTVLSYPSSHDTLPPTDIESYLLSENHQQRRSFRRNRENMKNVGNYIIYSFLGITLLGLFLWSCFIVLSDISGGTLVSHKKYEKWDGLIGGKPGIKLNHQQLGGAKSPAWDWNTYDIEYEFARFMESFKKEYSTVSEFFARRGIFWANFLDIHLHNSKNSTVLLSMNQFGDWTNYEFVNLKPGLKHDIKDDPPIDYDLLKYTLDDLPKQLDYRDINCVTPVKNQGSCGSCWAFGITGALESAICKKTSKLFSLSEQQLMDCSKSYGNEGCSGGGFESGYDYLLENPVLCTEKEYPYEGHDDYCQTAQDDCTSVPFVLDSFAVVPPGNEVALAASVAIKGPTPVAVAAGSRAWQFYGSGVLSQDCGDVLNHAVLAVGYGHDEATDLDYWLIKNSWGEDYGESGYLKIARNTNVPYGVCSVTALPMYVNIRSSNKNSS